jgi:hypothetical protein
MASVFDFLGMDFRKMQTPRGRQFCYCGLSRRSMQRIRDKLRRLIRREARVLPGEKTARLNPVLRGAPPKIPFIESRASPTLISTTIIICVGWNYSSPYWAGSAQVTYSLK